MVPLIVVLPRWEFRTGKSPIGFNGAALQMTCARIGHWTSCSAAVADGDEIASLLELEKLLQVCTGKYPALSLGFFSFKRVSGSKISSAVVMQSSEGGPVHKSGSRD